MRFCKMKNSRTYKIIIYIFICIFFLFSTVVAQTFNINGRIEMQDDDSEPFYDVMALRSDSTIYKGDVFFTSDFCFSVNVDSIAFVKFSCLGYEAVVYMKDEIISKAYESVVELGSIKLISNIILEDIAIVAKRKPFIFTPTGYSINVKDSYLSSFGTFNDVVMRVPGVAIMPKGGIEVIGKSNILFVLNGRRLSSTSELETLNPQNIKYIYVDQNPGPEYDSSYDAVLRIETIEYAQDFYYIDIRNRLEVSRVFGDNYNLILENKRGDFIYGLNIEYSTNGYKQYDKEHKEIWIESDSVVSDRNSRLKGRNKALLLIPSIKWKINNYNSFNAIYKFNYKDSDSDSKQDFVSTVLTDEVHINTQRGIESNRTYHNPSFFYNFEKEGNKINISADYYISKNKDIQKISEQSQNGDLKLENYNFKDNYKVWGIAADYIKTFEKWEIKTGGKISGIKDEGKYVTNKESLINNTLNDDTYALYTGISGNLNKFTFIAALRSEWNEITYKSSSYNNPIHSTYFNLFPSFSVKYSHPNSHSFSLSYRKSIQRPSYKQINPNSIYLDPLSYMIGNPLLKSKLTDELSFSFQYSSIYLSLGYNIEKNPSAQVSLLDENHKVAFTYTNIPEVKNITFLAMYSLNYKWLKSSISLRTLFQDIRFQGRIYSKFKDLPTNIGRINLDMNFWKNGSFNITGFYYNNYQSYMIERKNSGYISFGVYHSFMNNKLKLNAGFVDAFKLYYPNTWKQYLPNSYTNMHSNADSRCFYITLQYRFGNMKSTQSTKSIISDEKSRL